MDALLRNWKAVHFGLVGLIAQLVLVTGTIITDEKAIFVGGTSGAFTPDRGLGVSKLQGYLQAYLTSSLHWAWIIGLIAFGVFIGRKLGDLFAELEPSA